jgi:hypothetical protein
MNERIVLIIITFGLFLLCVMYDDPLDSKVKEIEIITKPNTEILPQPKVDRGFQAFLDSLAFKESTNNYKSVNRWGYMGKYQFGHYTLHSLGYDISRTEFINNPDLQEKAMLTLLLHNQKNLSNVIERWDGKYKGGILITESGILAAAHLGGPRNVRNYFRYGIDFKDANGTSISKYLKLFGGYEIDFDGVDPIHWEYAYQKYALL